MIQQNHAALIRSLRRVARALAGNLSAGDALVAKVLADGPLRRRSLWKSLALMMRLHRQAVKAGDDAHAAPLPDVISPHEIVAAFDVLPLQSREILALVAVENLSYENAARVLDLPLEIAMARLTVARTVLDRLVHGQNPAPLRLVQ